MTLPVWSTVDRRVAVSIPLSGRPDDAELGADHECVEAVPTARRHLRRVLERMCQDLAEMAGSSIRTAAKGSTQSATEKE
jgi:hypothetical protein